MLAFKKKQSTQNVLPFKAENQINTLDSQSLVDVLKSIEGRLVSKLLPKLQNKKVLLFSPQDRPFIRELVSAEKPEESVQLLLTTHNQELATQRIYIDTKGVPLKPNTFDCVIANMTDDEVDFEPIMKQLSFCLKSDGVYILTAKHPCLDVITKNQNPFSDERIAKQLQDYINFMRLHNLYLEDLKEGLITHEVKTFFTLAKNDTLFNDYLGIPLVISFRFVKYNPNEH